MRTNAMMLQVADAPNRAAAAVSFRTRRRRKDLSCGVNNVVALEQFMARGR